MTGIVTIDGAAGGGQMLRNAVVLSAVSGRPVRVVNIRGSRPKPGLRPQHLTAIQATAQACGAELVGAEIGAREIAFRPGRIEVRPDWHLDVGTAGSVMLVLQCLLPALIHAPGESRLTLIGGTDVPFAPPYDHFRQVFLPSLAALGPRVESQLLGRGFYPKGGGEVTVQVTPTPRIAPIVWTERGRVTRVSGHCYSLGLPAHVAERMRTAAWEVLNSVGYGKAEIALEVKPQGLSTGCGIVLWAETESGRRLGGSALGERGKPAERVGEEAARSLLQELKPRGAVDSHLADQLVLWMALADGPSELTTSRVTDHLTSAAQVAETIVGAQFSVEEGRFVRVTCSPARGEE